MNWLHLVVGNWLIRRGLAHWAILYVMPTYDLPDSELTAEEQLIKQAPLARVRSNLYREMYSMSNCPCTIDCEHKVGGKLDAFDRAVEAFELVGRETFLVDYHERLSADCAGEAPCWICVELDAIEAAMKERA